MNNSRFYGRDARTVAKDLLGRVLVRTSEKDRGLTAGTIIETGAFEGDEGRKGREGMSYAPGTIYIMSFRGNHFLNIATGNKGEPSCVLIRDVALHDGALGGPGRVGKFFGVEYLNGHLIGEELRIDGGEQVPASRIAFCKDGTSENCLGYYSIKS